jgi:hypothetical protein
MWAAAGDGPHRAITHVFKPALARNDRMRHNRPQKIYPHQCDQGGIHAPHPARMILCCAAMPALTAEEDIVLRGMGSFHVGGRVAEVSGKAVRMIVRQPGGPQTKLDPNGQYMVEQMYVQYFLPRQRKGKLPLLMWHGGGLTGVTYESTPDGREGWLNLFVGRAGTSTSPTRSSAAVRASRPPTSGPRSRPS